MAQIEEFIEGRVDPVALDSRQASLQEDLFGTPPLYVEKRLDLDPADSRMTELLDLLMVLTLRNPDEISYIWTRASIGSVIGKYGEAAQDFLEAGRRSEHAASLGEGLTDEEDWAESAFYHAAINFIDAGLLASAAHILGKLHGDLKSEIVTKLLGASP